MNKYSVLKLGDKIQFELDQSTIEQLVRTGYKKISEVEATSVGDARYKYTNKDDHQKAAGVSSNQRKNPTGYLKITSNLFFALSIIGCLVLIFLGIEANEYYGTRRFAIFYFVGAFASFLLAILIHSVCRVLIFIASNCKAYDK